MTLLGGRRELSVTGNGCEEVVNLVTIRCSLYAVLCGPYFVQSTLFTPTDTRTRVDYTGASKEVVWTLCEQSVLSRICLMGIPDGSLKFLLIILDSGLNKFRKYG